jgi:outer membrane receptor protein involved in Fe transport
MHTPKKLILGAAIAACFSSQPTWLNPLWAAELNTKLPQPEEEILFTRTISIDLPSQPLATSLKAISTKLGINITFNDALVNGKKAPAISGTMLTKELFKKLLANSNLEAKLNQSTLYIQPAAKTAKELKDEKTSLDLDKVEVRAKKFYEVGPMPGLALTKEEIPGNVQSITAKEIKDSHSLSLTDLMNSKLQSVNVNDYQSNPFQMDLQYRGFTASPQLGTAQGISVFLDGIRVNEPFGDVVNWDMLPLNALTGLDVFPGSNPIFGLGTLGGAIAMRTKSGFDGKSLDMEVLGGSFERKQFQVSAGGNNGVVAGFMAGTFFMEDGWRDNSPSKVNQLFGKAEWQNDRARLGLSMLYAGNKLTGNGLLPEQMVDQNPKQVYTSPDESKNDLLQFQLSGIWDVTDKFNITGQIYNRKSKRKSHTSDVNNNFGGSESKQASATTRDPSRQLLGGLQDLNRDGLPDYNDYAYNVAAGADGRALDKNGIAFGDQGFDINNLAYGTNFKDPANANQVKVAAADGSGDMVWSWTTDPRKSQDTIGVASNIPDVFNAPVASTQYAKLVRFAWDNRAAVVVTNNTFLHDRGLQQSSNTLHPTTGISSYDYDLMQSAFSGGILGTYTDDNGFFHDYQELFNIVNAGNYPDLCVLSSTGNNVGGPCVIDANGNQIYRDGKYGALNGFSETGYIEGTPTAIFNDTQIDQVGKGAALQLNWNLDQHKFMLGASYDTSDSTYVSKQYLGLLDANRHAYTAPDQLGWEYYANSKANGFGLNDFKGDNTTKSLYFSETWTPIKTLNITASARFNHTRVNNQLAVSRLGSFGDVNRILNLLNALTLCTDNNNDGIVDASECPNGVDGYIVPFDPSYGYLREDGNSNIGMDPGLKEKFKYRSFNPSLGFTWQAREDLNLYGNLSRGARTPTTIELGCAFDDSPVFDKFDPDTGEPIFVPRTFRERRNCNLPGAMSGDPYLKQVRSTSLEFGARGQWTDNIEWNASVYRTDLTDDIYFVSVNATQSYFQNIGNTRRQGLEMGLKGKWGKTSFGINYGLTDATFQSEFSLASPNNSSAGNVYDLNANQEGSYGQIKVKPGNRMPGVPLHNLNFNLGYEITDKWNVRLNMIMHSEAFVRGNENNKHEAGPATPLNLCEVSNAANCAAVPRADFREGTTAGYAVFNLRSSYKLTPEWTLGVQINNLFDTEYASAGRLGLNAFSPATLGVVGDSGFNYNSSEWQGTSFLGTGAPRSAFLTLSYEFQPKKLDALVK